MLSEATDTVMMCSRRMYRPVDHVHPASTGLSGQCSTHAWKLFYWNFPAAKHCISSCTHQLVSGGKSNTWHLHGIRTRKALLQGSANPQAGEPVGKAPLLPSTRPSGGHQAIGFNPPLPAVGHSRRVAWDPTAIPAAPPREASGPVTRQVRTCPSQPARNRKLPLQCCSQLQSVQLLPKLMGKQALSICKALVSCMHCRVFQQHLEACGCPCWHTLQCI